MIDFEFKKTKNLHSQFFVTLLLGFIMTIQLGAFLTEKVKAYRAEQLDFSSSYNTSLGKLNFYHDELFARFASIRAQYEEVKELQKSSEWQEAKLLDQKYKAKIELAGKLFTIGLSVIGLLILTFRRRAKKTFQLIDVFALLLSLFFMRDVFFNVWYSCAGFIFCDEATLWHEYSLDPFLMIKLYSGLGLLIFAYILYLIPTHLRWTYLLSGALGTIIGASFWYLKIGEWCLA